MVKWMIMQQNSFIIMEIISEVNQNSFVIMDELGSGTDPTEGMGIAVAILEELRKSNALFLVTTHYPEVKEYAAKKDGIVNARMTFDRKSLTPTYQMIIGEAGESCAFYIAEHLGMPQSMLKVAVTAAYGEKAAEKYEFQNRETVIKKENAYGTATGQKNMDKPQKSETKSGSNRAVSGRL